MPDSIDLATPQVVHVVAIGGGAMSALATVFLRMGHRVSGSDVRESRGLERLRLLGADIHLGHDAAHVPADVTVVVASTAIASDNPEVVQGRELGAPVLTRAEAQRLVVATRRTVAVAGSHGKTTTSSMLALVMRGAGLRPSFLIGADLNEVGANAAWDDGEWLVVEADESDGTFLALDPEAAIVTNVEPDHLAYHGSFGALADAFRRFVEGVPGLCVAGADDPVTRALARDRAGTVTFGFSDDADYVLRDYAGSRAGSRFMLASSGRDIGVIELPVPGRHNALNAAAAASTALELGVPFPRIARALGAFAGVVRRFQFRGTRDGVTYVDDYAHIPGEVTAMVAAAREGGWRHVIVVFQPHRYSRTAALWRDFADAFVGSDTLVLTDVYPADEPPVPGVSGRLVLRAVLDAHPDQPTVYLPRRGDLATYVPQLARDGDLVLTLGAGDLTSLPDEWLAVAP
jgi:UDP-N-acetylmuramate--alanine ligase